MDVYCGCYRKEMIQWLESHFEDWMTWENFGHGAGHWSIDHIRPLSSFKGTEDRGDVRLELQELTAIRVHRKYRTKREKHTK